MSTKEKAPATTEETEGKVGRRKKLVLVLVVVLLAAAAAVYFLVFAGSGEAEAAPEPEHGWYVALEPIAVNLAGGGYLMIGITLEITAEAGGDGHGGAAVDGAKAYDQIISTFSQAKPADVTGARDALKESLEAKIIEAYTEDEVPLVMGIYYTEYVTQ